ncbi:ATP-binding protein [Spirosoma sp. BT702]|uniref:ATP-binding protein n=1 Tax=Spirosoma profusum TaxID=2771354 RepID=A0A926XY40_9BACT|nr:ATP-binding protein [Spirosoma profusum]MBD2703069.1 ATP-binding protein [Spirosoma profusum]
MIKPEEFPYIKSLYVNDCYAYKKFNIELHDYKPFSHLILTGKNGSGKSTILSAIDRRFFFEDRPESERPKLIASTVVAEKEVIRINETTVPPGKILFQVEINFTIPHNINKNGEIRAIMPQEIFNHYHIKVYSYFKARRWISIQEVDGPSKELDFVDKLNSKDSTNYFTSAFKQYLVNKKIDQAFAQIDQRIEQVKTTEAFFKTLREKLSEVFGIKIDSIEFDHKSYEFYLHLEDGRRLTFDILPEGFSAVLTILMDLFMRVDLIRKQVNDYSYDPCGIVLIDEPEAHLHLQLQEQILPLLIDLFPNIQFIAATHSPAVIASIKNATIFDLTTKETRISEDAVGRSYSDLMMSHFGLNNEYSKAADDIILQVNSVLNTFGNKPEEMKAALQKIYDENSAYLSPTLKVELELLIAQQEAQQIAHQ